MEGLYSFMINQAQLSARPVLEGLSRGGLFALNWGIKHPDRTKAIYLDAPVCDFNSWPGGKGRGEGSSSDWEECLRVYGLTEESVSHFAFMPIDNLNAMAEENIPIIVVAGDSDKIVPMEENTCLLEERYRAMGGRVQVIVKQGVGHHPHGLDDPSPIIDFIERNAIFESTS